MTNPDRYTLHVGDSLAVLPTLPADSVDAIVTDPPYGLSFMGKDWDHGVPGVAFWVEALRVAKPGAHLLAFSGSRTYHRLASAIEDAGWEIRDQIMWVYGSGFPKSLDVSKAIDKQDARDEQLERRYRFTAWVRSTGVTPREISEATETDMGHHYSTHPTQPLIMTRKHLEQCRHLLGDVPEWVERECDIRSIESRNFASREVVDARMMTDGTKAKVGFAGSAHSPDYDGTMRLVNITAPASEEAKRWNGWGTALKPAHEPIVVARKPLAGTVAENVLKYGTGGINVDGCRVGTDGGTTKANIRKGETNGERAGMSFREDISFRCDIATINAGRWPANFIHDGSDEATDGLGIAARFFYCAKASKADRDEGCEGNHHPTVKPTDLMRYLCRLVTPPGGLVLDPFTGSGSTGKAALLEGFRFVGVELSEDYAAIARARLDAACAKSSEHLFGVAE